MGATRLRTCRARFRQGYPPSRRSRRPLGTLGHRGGRAGSCSAAAGGRGSSLRRPTCLHGRGPARGSWLSVGRHRSCPWHHAASACARGEADAGLRRGPPFPCWRVEQREGNGRISSGKMEAFWLRGRDDRAWRAGNRRHRRGAAPRHKRRAASCSGGEGTPGPHHDCWSADGGLTGPSRSSKSVERLTSRARRLREFTLSGKPEFYSVSTDIESEAFRRSCRPAPNSGHAPATLNFSPDRNPPCLRCVATRGTGGRGWCDSKAPGAISTTVNIWRSLADSSALVAKATASKAGAVRDRARASSGIEVGGPPSEREMFMSRRRRSHLARCNESTGTDVGRCPSKPSTNGKRGSKTFHLGNCGPVSIDRAGRPSPENGAYSPG